MSAFVVEETLKISSSEWPPKQAAKADGQIRYSAIRDDDAIDMTHESSNFKLQYGGLLEAALSKRFKEVDVKVYRRIQLKRRPEEGSLAKPEVCQARVTHTEDMDIPAISQKCAGVDRKCIYHSNFKSCDVRYGSLANEVLLVRIGKRTMLAKVTYENSQTHAGAGQKWHKSVTNELNLQARAAHHGLAPKVSPDSFMFKYKVNKFSFNSAMGSDDSSAPPPSSYKAVNKGNGTHSATRQRTEEYSMRGAVILMENLGDNIFRSMIHNIIRVPNHSAIYNLLARTGAAICDLVSKAGVDHQDMHLDNIRVVSDNVQGVEILRPVFIDFGLGKYLSSDKRINQPVEIQNMIRNKCQAFYIRLLQNGLKFLKSEKPEMREKLLKTIRLMRDMHHFTTHVPKGKILHHTFNYHTSSKTAFIEDPKTKYATAQSFFESKLKRVPAVFLSPTVPKHNTYGRVPVHLLVSKPVYNVLCIDSLHIWIDDQYSGFDGLRRLLASPILESLWEGTTFFGYRKKYLSNHLATREEHYMESDMPLFGAFGKLFSGWELMKDVILEQQFTLMRKSMIDSCVYAMTSKGELEIENISQYENLRKQHGQPANNNFGGSPAYNDATFGGSPAYDKDAYLAETPVPSSMSPASDSALPSQKPGSPVYAPTSDLKITSPAYSPTSPAYSPASPAYSPTSPAYTP